MTEPTAPSPEHAHFAAIPWCARHLLQPGLVTAAPASRGAKASGEDSLFARTLKTGATIGAMLEVYGAPPGPPGGARVDEVKVFLTLGRGMDGHAGVLHGGIVAAILDEVIGVLIPINLRRGAISGDGTYLTAFLNTRFVRPVMTPGTVLARARFVRVEGRKFWAEGTVEDEGGRVLAGGEALYVLTRSKL